MKLHVPSILTPALLGGALGGAIFRDLIAGPIIGLAVGLIIGLLIALFVLPFWGQRSGNSPGNAITIIILLLAALLPFGLMKFMYAPPPSLLFSRLVMSPRPDSVTNIKVHTQWSGRNQVYALSFQINREDLDYIIEQHGFQPEPGDPREAAARYAAVLDQPPPWWNLAALPAPAPPPEVYRVQEMYDRILIYDPTSGTAFFLVFPQLTQPEAST